MTKTNSIKLSRQVEKYLAEADAIDETVSTRKAIDFLQAKASSIIAKRVIKNNKATGSKDAAFEAANTLLMRAEYLAATRLK